MGLAYDETTYYGQEYRQDVVNASSWMWTESESRFKWSVVDLWTVAIRY